jgi:hypothetical protein
MALGWAGRRRRRRRRGDYFFFSLSPAVWLAPRPSRSTVLTLAFPDLSSLRPLAAPDDGRPAARPGRSPTTHSRPRSHLNIC